MNEAIFGTECWNIFTYEYFSQHMMNMGGVVFALRSRKRTEIKGLAEYVCNDVNEKNSIPKGEG